MSTEKLQAGWKNLIHLLLKAIKQNVSFQLHFLFYDSFSDATVPSTATPLVSLICEILMVKEDFHFSFPNQTLEVTFLKSAFKSNKNNPLLNLS